MSEGTAAITARAGEGSLLRPWATALAEPLAEALAVATLCPMLLTAAIWNGFPLTFYDTGAYMHEGLGNEFIVERSPVYSLFLLFGGAGASLWWIVILQAAMSAFVMVETVRALRPSMSLRGMIGIGALLTVATGLPWYAGQIEPDCMTAIVVLSLYLLAFHTKGLGHTRTGLLLATVALATGAHPSHLGLSAGLVLCVVAYRLVSRKSDWPRANIALPAAGFAAGLLLVLAANFHFTGAVFVSRAGPNFEFARLVQDGIARRDLDAICPEAGLKLCPYRFHLPNTADEWLWGDSAFNTSLNRFEGTRADSEYVVRDSLARFPWMNLKAAASDAGKQFVSFATGDQIEPQAWILYPDFDLFVPGQIDAYMHSRQQRDQIDFKLINLVHVPVAWLGLLGLPVGLWLAISGARAKARAVPRLYTGRTARQCRDLRGDVEPAQSLSIAAHLAAGFRALPFGAGTADLRLASHWRIRHLMQPDGWPDPHRSLDSKRRFRAPWSRDRSSGEGGRRSHPCRRDGRPFRAQHHHRAAGRKGAPPPRQKALRRASDDFAGRPLSRSLCGRGR